jgi:HEAT repeat protein
VARTLGTLDHPAVIPALVKLVKAADNSEVAGMASVALTNLGTMAIPALTHLLNEPEHRLLAVQSLAQIHHPSVVPPLLDVVNDPSSLVRAATITALTHFHEAVIPPILIAALQDPVARVRQAAINGLAFREDLLKSLDLIHRLKPFVWDVDLEVCQQTAIALGRLGTNEASAVLFEVLNTATTPIVLQIEAVRALAWISAPQALHQLQQFLCQPGRDTTVYQEIVAVLGRVELPEAKIQASQILVEVLQSPHLLNQSTRGQQLLAQSLGQLGQIEAINPLIQLLAAPEESVRFHAIAALKQLDAALAFERLQTLAQQEGGEENLQEGVAIALQEWNAGNVLSTN